jgi:hypothetical protein
LGWRGAARGHDRSWLTGFGAGNETLPAAHSPR